jgi:hypothetical protein
MNHHLWLEHFRRNAQHRKEPDWQAPLAINGARLRKLTHSLEQFQLGDGGGDAYLMAWDRESFLGRDPAMRELVDLWFHEEEEHSRLLGAALKRFGGTELTTHWSFELFCTLRRRLGVQFELYVLVLTEIVSHVYYKMLHRHGQDPALREMCRLIIRDESGHIAFHRARLAADNGNYGPLWALLFRLRGLAAGTVLWMNHRPAIVALGGSTAGFYTAIWRGMSRFIEGLRRDVAEARAASRQETQADNIRGSQNPVGIHLAQPKAGLS